MSLTKEQVQAMNLTKLGKYLHAINVEKGFWEKERNMGEALMLVNSELCEAFEAHRNNNFFPDNLNAEKYELTNLTKEDLAVKACFEIEIADTIYRLLDLCAGFNIDIEAFIAMKATYNKNRPYKHGKNY